MARFQFRLATLLRLRISVRDQRREQLAEALQAQQKLQQQRDEKQDELQRLRQDVAQQTLGHVDVDRLVNSQRYELTLKADLQVLTEQGRLLTEECERRRAALVTADRDVRALEKLEERQQAEHEQHHQRRLQHEMDEVANRTAALKTQA